MVCGRPPTSLVGDRAKEDPDEHQHDKAKLLEQEQEGMVDYRALATTPVTTAERAMRAYQSSAAAANMTTVMQGSWRSTGCSRSAGDAETRARELAEAAADAWRRRRARARERESQGEMALSMQPGASWRPGGCAGS